MHRKIVAVWMSLVMIFGLIVIIDLVTDFTPTVHATTLYVNTTGSGGAYNNIQDAINAANDGDTIFVYNGNYHEFIDIDKRLNLIGENKENTRIDYGGWREQIKILSNWVNITGFTVEGAGYLDDSAGISLSQVQNCNISNNNITECRNGIYLYDVNNSTFLNNNIFSHNRNGISISSSENNSLINNTIFSNDWSGIVSSGSVKNKLIDNYIFDCNRLGIYMHSSIGYIIINNTIIDNGIYLEGFNLEYWNTHNISTSNTVNDNPIYYHKNNTGGNIPIDAGQVILANCSNYDLKNLNLSYGSVGISLGFSSNINITNNTAMSNKKNFIYMYSSVDNYIFNNSVSRDKYIEGDDYIIFLFRSSGNILKENHLKYTDVGLYLYESHNNTIFNNTIEESSTALAVKSSNNNNITNNSIWGHSTGVGIRTSFNNSINSNIIHDSLTGIYLVDCGNNMIFHNSFINNEMQATDNTYNNSWDNGYPFGGNFWSDYNGSDEFNGPDQDIPGNDGLGDTNYSINNDSQDNYPLMSPVGDQLFFYDGWNIISIPFIQSNTHLGKILEQIDGSYDAVQWYNVSDVSDQWKHYHVSKPSYLNDLTDIEYRMGFWIHITEPDGVLYEYSGTAPTSNQTIPLHPGWNMVGYPSLSNHNRTVGLNNLDFGTDVDCIQWYDATTKNWHFMDQDDYFTSGRGYWVHAKVEAGWEVPI